MVDEACYKLEEVLGDDRGRCATPIVLKCVLWCRQSYMSPAERLGSSDAGAAANWEVGQRWYSLNGREKRLMEPCGESGKPWSALSLRRVKPMMDVEVVEWCLEVEED